MTVSPSDAVSTIWKDAGLPAASLAQLSLSDHEPAIPSSFAVGTAAQASVAVSALAAREIWHHRTGQSQRVSVSMRAATAESTSYFKVEGRELSRWEKYSGLYACGEEAAAPGYIRIHANFAHHRDRALRVLGLPSGDVAAKEDVTAALRRWRAEDFESASIDAGAVASALRTFEQWDAHPQAAILKSLPLVSIEKIGDAPALSWPSINPSQPPLHGLRMLDLTRVLAGPLAGRTLAAYGADVLMINSPNLPNIDAIMDLSRGKLSALLDVDTTEGRAGLARLLGDAHVFVQGYRPGALAAKGFSPADLARSRPGIVVVSLSAYGHEGPWRDRRGFDSIVQTATGFNDAEGRAFAAGGNATPKALPVQILDCASGFLMAFGAQVALLRQANEGGSWHVRIALGRTGEWLRSLGRIADGPSAPQIIIRDLLQTFESGYGRITGLPHAAIFERTPAQWLRPSMPPGSHPPQWPPYSA